MKIAFIGQKGIPALEGGIERHVEELAVRLAANGNDCFVYSNKKYNDIQSIKYKGVKIKYLPTIQSKSLATIVLTFLATLDTLRNDYDIIHYHGVGPATLSFIPRLFKPRSKVITTFHCRDKFHQKWGILARTYLGFGEFAACKFANKTIAVSQSIQQFCADKYNTKAYHIPNGFTSFSKDKKSNILEKLNLNPNEYILTVNRLVRHKGIHYLIDSYNNQTTNKKLVIVGDSANTDEYATEIRNKAKNNPNIILAGKIFGTDLKTLYTNAYLYVQPSEAEGLPTVVLETMSLGTPALVSNIPENLEATGGYGLSFVNRDVKDLSEKLSEALMDHKYIEATGLKAKKYVSERYNWDYINKQIEYVYNCALPKKSTEKLLGFLKA